MFSLTIKFETNIININLFFQENKINENDFIDLFSFFYSKKLIEQKNIYDEYSSYFGNTIEKQYSVETFEVFAKSILYFNINCIKKSFFDYISYVCFFRHNELLLEKMCKFDEVSKNMSDNLNSLTIQTIDVFEKYLDVSTITVNFFENFDKNGKIIVNSVVDVCNNKSKIVNKLIVNTNYPINFNLNEFKKQFPENLIKKIIFIENKKNILTVNL